MFARRAGLDYVLVAASAFLFALYAVPVAGPGAAFAAADKPAGEAEKGEFLGAKNTVYPAWFKDSFLDFNEDVKEAAANGKRIMILFEQDGCPYCNAFVERNLSQKDIEDKVRKNFEVIAINMWGDREVMTVDGKPYTEKNFASALKVQFTPTILFLDEKGKVVLRLNGYLPPDKFTHALDYVAQKKENELSYNQYVATHASTSASGELNKQPFFTSPPYDLQSRLKEQKPLAVFFEQKQCPNCDALHNKVLANAETRNIVNNFISVQLDMWSDQEIVTPEGKKMTAREWARELDVKYAPSIVLFNPEGREVIRSEAFFKSFHTQGIFDYVLSRAYKDEPSFQRYLSEKAEHLREQGKDVNIWE